MSENSKTVLVTGAGGLVGHACVNSFLSRGYKVIAADKSCATFAELEARGATPVEVDVTRESDARAAVSKADIVVHGAAIFDFGASEDLLQRVNVGGTKIVAAAAAEKGVERFVQISSVGVYGEPRSAPTKEEADKNPRNAYERSKWQSEQIAWEIARDAGIEMSAIRPTLIYGPRSRYGLAMMLGGVAVYRFRKYSRGLNIRGGKYSHYVHVDDVGEAAFFAATSDAAPGRSFNVADKTPVTAEIFIDALYRAFGVGSMSVIPGIITKIGSWIASFGDPLRFVSTINKHITKHWNTIRAEYGLTNDLNPRIDNDWILYGGRDHIYSTENLESLGFTHKYPSFLIGFQQTVDWYKENNWLPKIKSKHGEVK
ncbi:MAG: NAD(P)-dependent oxidoreductase [Planctomycetes bacterium]|nr:NAD(P)-dependent oxidoreductase [Planctomycetota bacterium]